MDRDLDELQDELDTIANLTQGAETTIVNMKDSTTSAQKSSQPGNTGHSVSLNYLCVWVYRVLIYLKLVKQCG